MNDCKRGLEEFRKMQEMKGWNEELKRKAEKEMRDIVGDRFVIRV